MIIQLVDNTDNEERNLLIDNLLPKESIIQPVIEVIESYLFNVLTECLKKEIEIYRKYPKKINQEDFDNIINTFEPRMSSNCFMGKAFKYNDQIINYELTMYRKRIGTIDHVEWGNATLLEIWAADHFKNHKKMVVDTFKYGMCLTDELPDIKFFINPLFKNQNSGKIKPTQSAKEQEKYLNELLRKAIKYGVKGPKNK